MRLFSLLLTAFCALSALQAQDLVRGSYRLGVEELRSESALRMTLSNDAGIVLYRIDRELGYDTPRPAVHLFADGTTLLVDSFAGVYELYSTGGQMVSRVPFEGEVRPNHERITFLSGNDTSAAVLTSEPGKAGSRILLLDRSGIARFDRPFEGSFASGLLLSPDGRLIAAGTFDWNGSLLSFRTEFLGIIGTSVSSFEHEFKGGSWSPQGNLFVVYGRKDATLFDVEKGQVVSALDLGENRIVHDVFWDGTIPCIASSPVPRLESGRWIYPRLTVLNLADGTTVFQSVELSFKSVKLERTAGGISAMIDGRSIRIR